LFTKLIINDTPSPHSIPTLIPGSAYASNNMFLYLIRLTSFLFNIIIEVAIMSAKTSYGQQIVACNVGNSILYWCHLLAPVYKDCPVTSILNLRHTSFSENL